MTLGEQIRTAREAKNLSQEALAEHLSVSRQAVSKWENGTAVPQGANMAALIEVLGLDIEANKPAPQKHGIAVWLGWTVAAILLLALVGFLAYWKTSVPDAPDTSDPGPSETPHTVTGPTDTIIKEPTLLSIRFFDETQQEVPFSDPHLMAYNMALVDSILLQWIGPDAVLETVKAFCTPTGGKTEFLQEFTVPRDSSYAVLLPADALFCNEPARLYFELHFSGNYTITTEDIHIYFDENIALTAYIEGFDGRSLTYDKAEWVDVPGDRADALGITDEDAPNGFYIYNEREAAAQRLVSDECTYTVLDWEANFVPVTVSASEFQAILGERTWPGTPYVLTFRDNEIVAVQEYYIP